ncbi:glycosyltransferase [Modestobacter sp. KNN46-3]|jgi:GT2 family glycosyltransferase|uniref:glycosyltransferase n=1 Tax=Modestobacter sp. KNN46-3 TaxID=2711218 RepID=UPI0013DEC4AC|nr:glycosyltransferase [Modestobacter sp. KNN46-3]
MTLLHLLAVNYFGSGEAGGLVRSLLGQERPDWQLTLIDNSESAEETERLRALTTDPRVDVVRAPGNLGYFRAVAWFTAQRATDADWVAVCNVDLELAGPAFTARLGALDRPTSLLAPHIVALPSGRPQNPYMAQRPTARRMLFRRLVLSTRLSARAAQAVAARKRAIPTVQSEPAQQVYAPHGSFMLFPRAWSQVGGSFDHPPFLFGEEVTVGERARRLGLDVRYEPSLEVVHREHQATGQRSRRLFRAQREAAAHAHRLITGRVDEAGVSSARRGKSSAT